jgi:hypothetical protein
VVQGEAVVEPEAGPVADSTSELACPVETRAAMAAVAVEVAGKVSATRRAAPASMPARGRERSTVP